MIREKISELIDLELEEANKKHPLFVDNHQAYAVILEEFEETAEELERVHESLERAWEYTRLDLKCQAYFNQIFSCAMFMICEAVQLAAMAQKAIISENEREGAVNDRV